MPLVIQQIDPIITSSKCIFGLVQGVCNYNLNNPPVLFSLGEGIAALGLIFAVYQLRNESWKMILRLRVWWQRNLPWIFSGAGLFFILISSLLGQVPVGYLSVPWNYPLLYEIIAFFLFIASPISLLYFSNNPRGLFSEKTAERFYSLLINEVSKSNGEGVNAAIEILLYNFRKICETAKQRENNDARQLAKSILDVILSDGSVVKILTTKRLDALHFIFDIVEKNSISRRESNIGIPKIMQNLFYDKESFFYKHLTRDGLALSSNIYDTIFDSPTLLTNFDFFGWPTFGFSVGKEFDIDELEVFMEALSRSIKTYLKQGIVPPRHINDGLSHLSDIFAGICSKISEEERRGVDTKYSLRDEWWALHLVADFLGHNYTFLAYQDTLNQTIKDREKNVPEADFYSDTTINAGIAAALYKGFEQLSYIENTTDTYHVALDLLSGMMHEDEYKYKEGYREPFEKRMWQQIAANIIRKHYSAPLRVYLDFIGFCLASDSNQRQGWVGEQAEKMRRLLYVDMKPLLDVNTEMVNKEKMKDVLLPKLMDYKDGKFTYKFEFGRGEEKIISPPAENSASSLTGIDLNHNSRV